MPTENVTSQKLGTSAIIDKDRQTKILPNKNKNLLNPKNENYLKTELKDIVSILEKNNNINNNSNCKVQNVTQQEKTAVLLIFI